MRMCEALATARETCKRLLMQAQEIVRDAGAKAKDAEEAEEQEEPLYSHCLRCGKALRRHESRQRGYGDTCWRQAVQYMETPADEPGQQQPAQ